MVHRGMLEFNSSEAKETPGNSGPPKGGSGHQTIVKKWVKLQRGRGAIAHAGNDRQKDQKTHNLSVYQ